MSSIRNQEEVDEELNEDRMNDPDSFPMTGVRIKTGLPDESQKKDEHLQAVDTLNKCVQSIDSHFKKVLVTHENDFMSAYQVSFTYYHILHNF